MASLGHRSEFQPASRLRFVTAPTSLNGGQPHFARCLAISCAATLYIHFGGSCPLTEFCQVQHSHCVQVLRFLYWQRYCTPAAGVSQTSGITELSQTAPPIFGWAASITLGIGPHSNLSVFALCVFFLFHYAMLKTAASSVINEINGYVMSCYGMQYLSVCFSCCLSFSQRYKICLKVVDKFS